MEIGSNFELDMSILSDKQDNIFNYLKSYSTIYTDSGRSALGILNRILKKGIVLLPSYLCSSITAVFQDMFTIQFYRVKKDFTIDLDDLESKLNEQITSVYIIHYFGTLQEEHFLDLLCQKKKEYGFTIIEDTTHSIFTKERTIGDFCICSLRKWFPIPDGGVLYSKKSFSDLDIFSIPKKSPSTILEAMILKKWYLLKKVDCNKIYRNIFLEEEKKLDNQKELFQISDISKSLLGCCSISQMIEKRKKNYTQLSSFLNTNGIETILKGDDFVPFTLPIYIKSRDEFRKYLSVNHVYCAVHWPLEETGLENCTEAMAIFKNILSLPIDQRYGKEHMEYLQEQIKKYNDKIGDNCGNYSNP